VVLADLECDQEYILSSENANYDITIYPFYLVILTSVGGIYMVRGLHKPVDVDTNSGETLDVETQERFSYIPDLRLGLGDLVSFQAVGFDSR